MLQINTGKYFREGVDLHETLQRHVLYTNTHVLAADPIRMAYTELAYSTGHRERSTVTVTFVEKLEKTHPDGTEELLIAVGGREITEDLGYVLAFVLDAVFNLDPELVRRLIAEDELSGRAGNRRILTRTFEPRKLVHPEQVQDAREFLDALLNLDRTTYEASMRAIRGVVDAANRVYDDPTLAYTLYVAALESLAQSTEAPPIPWEVFDPRKRRLFDEATEGLDEDHVKKVRVAALEAERAGLASRFRAFTMSHITESYYRSEAVGVLLPLRASELPAALTEAYKIRSGNIHLLAQLPREAWMFTDGYDTVRPLGGRPILSLAGLNRLTRHVIRRYVERGEPTNDDSFDYRAALPNIVRMEMASEYWVWNPDGLTHESANKYLAGCLDLWLNIVGGHREGWVDLRDLLAKVEQLSPGLDPRQRAPLLAIYAMWHCTTDESLHLESSDAFLEKYGAVLHEPSMVGFVVSLVCGHRLYTLDELRDIAARRRTERNNRQLRLPAVFDAALLAILADQLSSDGRLEDALAAIGEAIGELPGNAELMRHEMALADGQSRDLDVRAILVGDTAPASNGDSAGAAPSTEPTPEADLIGREDP